MKNCINHRLETQALNTPPKRGNSKLQNMESWIVGKVIQSGRLTLDDVMIEINRGTDGHWNKNTLASAPSAFCVYRNGNGFPYFGMINIYQSLLDVTNPITWRALFIHEFLHVLGFTRDFMDTYGGQENINGQLFYSGENAIKGYREILYNVIGEKTAFAIPDLRVPMENTGHWKTPELRWDIMSTKIHTQMYMTAVTMGALKDFGYAVDMTKVVNPPKFLTKPTIGSHFVCDGQHIRIADKP